MLKKAATLIPLILVLAESSGCAGLSGATKASVDFSCVLQDERLGAPFTRPEAAKAWLLDTMNYLRRVNTSIAAGVFKPTAEDLRKLADLADLVERASACLDIE